MLTKIGLDLWNAAWFAQMATPPPGDRTATLFTGPKFFVALIAGIILAFGFQLLLTNLSVAAGITYLGHQDSRSRSNQNEQPQQREGFNLGGTLRKISFAAGLWTLITVSLALFVACFLAIKLSLLFSPFLGAILGLVIWAAYFSLLVWFSSSRVSAALGSVTQTAIGGFQALMNTALAAVNTATMALGRNGADARVVNTARATAAAVRRELTGDLDSRQLQHALENYLDSLHPPQLDLKQVRQELVSLLRTPEVQSLIGTEAARKIDRQAFVNLARSRSDLSQREVNRLADQLHHTWQQFVDSSPGAPSDPIAELRDFLSTALPEKLRSNELNAKLDRLLSLVSQASSGQASSGPSPLSGLSGLLSLGNVGERLTEQAWQLALTTLVGIVLNRQDLSDLDVENILEQLGHWGQRLFHSGQALKSANAPSNTIRTDMENYILNTYAWQMRSDLVERDFREVLYDPSADPTAVRQQLETFGREDFARLLSQKGMFTQEEIGEIADRLAQIQADVLAQVRRSQEQEQLQELYHRLDSFLLHTPPADFNPDQIQHYFLSLSEESDAELEVIHTFWNQTDRGAFDRMLIQREDIGLEQRTGLLDQLLQSRDRTLEELHVRQTQQESQLQALRERIENYLRHTHKDELNPEGIERDLQTLLHDPQAGVAALRSRLSQFDRDTLVQLLSQRQDLSEEQINQTIDQFQTSWNRLVHAPQRVSEQARAQVDQVTTTLADYLRSTHLEELDPEGIQRDLSTLFSDPTAGMSALRRRLALIDRETLVRLLSQRQDLSEEQVNRAIDQVLLALRQIGRVPRRLASRTQARVVNLQTSLENYLRNTHKDALNPEGIKRDLQLLAQHPQTGWQHLGDRLSRIDRDTLVALLTQREMTEAEAHRVLDQIEAVLQQAVDQSRTMQRQIQALIETIFSRIRTYLNALERAELNYEGIQQDLRRLFADPQSGFVALRERLSNFNRDTLMAILHSRDDLPRTYIHRIVEQVEVARNNVLQRAERLQQATQQQVEELKRQAQIQAEETRKAAESAAWWLFGTAIVSALLSATAGAIAVVSS